MKRASGRPTILLPKPFGRRPNWRAVAWLVPLVLVLATGAWALPPLPPIPDSFLGPEPKVWHQILQTEITTNFDKAELRDVVSYLAIKTQANITLNIEQPGPLPVFTHRFDHVPLRAVLYQLSQDTGLTIEWELDHGFPRGIHISGKSR